MAAAPLPRRRSWGGREHARAAISSTAFVAQPTRHPRRDQWACGGGYRADVRGFGGPARAEERSFLAVRGALAARSTDRRLDRAHPRAPNPAAPEGRPSLAKPAC